MKLFGLVGFECFSDVFCIGERVLDRRSILTVCSLVILNSWICMISEIIVIHENYAVFKILSAITTVKGVSVCYLICRITQVTLMLTIITVFRELRCHGYWARTFIQKYWRIQSIYGSASQSRLCFLNTPARFTQISDVTDDWYWPIDLLYALEIIIIPMQRKQKDAAVVGIKIGHLCIMKVELLTTAKSNVPVCC